MRSSTIQAGLAQRARIVLLAANGLTNIEIATRVGVSRPTVTSWRTRLLTVSLSDYGRDVLVEDVAAR